MKKMKEMKKKKKKKKSSRIGVDPRSTGPLNSTTDCNRESRILLNPIGRTKAHTVLAAKRLKARVTVYRSRDATCRYGFSGEDRVARERE